MFNFFSYLGAALGGIVSGWIGEQWGWSGVYLMWAVFSTIAMLLLLLNGIYKEISYRSK